MLSVPYSVTPRLLLLLAGTQRHPFQEAMYVPHVPRPTSNRPATPCPTPYAVRPLTRQMPALATHSAGPATALGSHGQLDALLVARKVKETSAAGIQTSRRTARPAFRGVLPRALVGHGLNLPHLPWPPAELPPNTAGRLICASSAARKPSTPPRAARSPPRAANEEARRARQSEADEAGGHAVHGRRGQQEQRRGCGGRWW